MPRPAGPFDIAVVMPTLLRPSLTRAARSVFDQDFPGRIQLLLGVSALGDTPRGPLDETLRARPERVAVTIVDLGYPTDAARGGLYPARDGGVLRSLLSYAAGARHVAYLDDDNWWAPDHLSSLRAAIEGFDWAFSLRWYVDPDTLAPVAIDRWESVGPGRGIYRPRFGGFVDPNCLMLDKIACHWDLPAWSIPLGGDGRSADRNLFRHLVRGHPVAWTGRATAYYVHQAADRPIIRRLIAAGAAAEQPTVASRVGPV